MDGYLLEEQSCQILSPIRFETREPYWLLEERRHNNKNKTKNKMSSDMIVIRSCFPGLKTFEDWHIIL